MKYIASVSFGKDSLAMLIRLLKENYPLDEVIYFDIGADFECIKRNSEKMSNVLKQKHIEYTVLKPKEPFLYNMIEKPVQKRDGTEQNGYKWCGGCTRWGTTLKLQAIEENNKKYSGEMVVEYIGVASDERERINRERQKNKVKLYPLVEWNMTEKDCLEYCYRNGWHWDENGHELYDILDRVSCKYCKNKNLNELRNIYHYLPGIWEELKDIQDKVVMPYKSGKTVQEIEERFIREDAQMDIFDYMQEREKSEQQ